MKKLWTILLLVCMAGIGSYGQSIPKLQDKFLIGYEAAFPSGFISKASWSGGRVEYCRMIKKDLSVGLAASWNSFDQYVSRTTYQKPDSTGAVTTDIVKEIYTVPITASVKYYFQSDNNKALPYVGVGVGAQYSDQTIYLNIFQINEINWGFVVRPEIGIILPIDKASGVYISGAYNYATNKNDAFKIDNLRHFAVSVGFSF